jgi:hypothetical protein
VEIEERVDMIGDVVHFDEMAFLGLENALGVGVERGEGLLGEQGFTALGAED